MDLLRLFAIRRERRERVERDAIDFLFLFGNGAYAQARSLAEQASAKGEAKNRRHWSLVADKIADRSGLVVGKTAETRPPRFAVGQAGAPSRDRRPPS